MTTSKSLWCFGAVYENLAYTSNLIGARRHVNELENLFFSSPLKTFLEKVNLVWNTTKQTKPEQTFLTIPQNS